MTVVGATDKILRLKFQTEGIKVTSKIQRRMGKKGVETRRQSFIYISTCILYTSDGQEYFWEITGSGFKSDDLGHSRKPHGFSNLIHQATLQVFFFFPLISEGEDEVKKVQFFN